VYNFVRNCFLWWKVVGPLPNPPSCRTTACWPSTSGYSIYSLYGT